MKTGITTQQDQELPMVMLGNQQQGLWLGLKDYNTEPLGEGSLGDAPVRTSAISDRTCFVVNETSFLILHRKTWKKKCDLYEMQRNGSISFFPAPLVRCP